MGVITALVIAFVMSSGGSQTPVTPPGGPFSALKSKTAWVHLGALLPDNSFGTADTFKWIMKSESAPRAYPHVPAKHDRIELLRDQQLVVIGYLPEKSEKLVYESPTSIKRPLEPTDYTLLVCPIGAKLDVVDVQIGQPIYGKRPVWVRVTPPAR